MRKRYKALKTLMFSQDITQAIIAKAIKRSRTYVARCLSGVRPWSQNDIYAVCDYLEIPYQEIPLYFPRDGEDLDAQEKAMA